MGDLEFINRQKILTILGPTASGKTNLACQVAAEVNGEIISADSRQVYKGMDIGTGKDLEEFTIADKQIPYHLIDIKNPGYKYNIAEYEIDYHAALDAISKRGAVPILCGGSGLYIEAALSGTHYLGIPSDEKLQIELEQKSEAEIDCLYSSIDTVIKTRIGDKTVNRKIRAIQIDRYLSAHSDWQERTFDKPKSIIFGIDLDRDLRREKISNRLSYRMNNGLIEEAQLLIDQGLSHETMSYYGLEYKWLSMYLLKEISKKELYDGLNTAIHQFSKRQMTWFRRMEKSGYQIHWLRAEDSLAINVNKVIELYGKK